MSLLRGIELAALPMNVSFNRIKKSHSEIELNGAVFFEDSVRLPGVGIYSAVSPLTSGLRVSQISVTDSIGNFQFFIEQGKNDILIFAHPGMVSTIFIMIPKN